MSITRSEAKQIAEVAASKAVKETLTSLGLDVTNVLETQADQLYVRQQRLASEQVGTWTKRIIIVGFITGLGSVLWVGVSEGLKHILK